MKRWLFFDWESAKANLRKSLRFRSIAKNLLGADDNSVERDKVDNVSWLKGSNHAIMQQFHIIIK